MQRWEYCHIRSEFIPDAASGLGHSHTGLLYYTTGQAVSIDENAPVSIEKAITKLGNEGWELVTVTRQSSPHGYFSFTHYFKCPL